MVHARIGSLEVWRLDRRSIWRASWPVAGCGYNKRYRRLVPIFLQAFKMHCFCIISAESSFLLLVHCCFTNSTQVAWWKAAQANSVKITSFHKRLHQWSSMHLIVPVAPVALCLLYKNPPPVNSAQSLRLCTLTARRITRYKHKLQDNEFRDVNGGHPELWPGTRRLCGFVMTPNRIKRNLPANTGTVWKTSHASAKELRFEVRCYAYLVQVSHHACALLGNSIRRDCYNIAWILTIQNTRKHPTKRVNQFHVLLTVTEQSKSDLSVI